MGDLLDQVVPQDQLDQLDQQPHPQLVHPDLLDQLDQLDLPDQQDHQDHKVLQDQEDHQEPQLHHHHHAHQSAQRSVFQLVHNTVVQRAEESRNEVLGFSQGQTIMRLHHYASKLLPYLIIQTQEIYFYT